jgi:hypothetical protein
VSTALAVIEPKNHPSQRVPDYIETLESQLKDLHDSIGKRVLEAGKILVELKTALGHGNWDVYLNQLCKRTGVSPRAARYYIKAYRDVEAAGGPGLVQEAASAGLNLNKKPVRDHLIKMVQQTSNIPAAVKSAKFADSNKRKNPAIKQLAELRKKFPRMRIERTGGVLNGYEMSAFQVWADDVTAAQAPKGQETVTVVMTLDQSRGVQGKVSVGANNLSAAQVEEFAKSWSAR